MSGFLCIASNDTSSGKTVNVKSATVLYVHLSISLTVGLSICFCVNLYMYVCPCNCVYFHPSNQLSGGVSLLLVCLAVCLDWLDCLSICLCIHFLNTVSTLSLFLTDQLSYWLSLHQCIKYLVETAGLEALKPDNSNATPIDLADRHSQKMPGFPQNCRLQGEKVR